MCLDWQGDLLGLLKEVGDGVGTRTNLSKVKQKRTITISPENLGCFRCPFYIVGVPFRCTVTEYAIVKPLFL